MELSYPRMRRLVDDLPTDMQGRGLGVEVQRAHADEEGDVDALGGVGAGGGFGGDAADGGGAEEVRGLDEVVGVPLRGRAGVSGVKDAIRERAGRTMSSCSSGLRVTEPEPSRSMACLMSCILDTEEA